MKGLSCQGSVLSRARTARPTVGGTAAARHRRAPGRNIVPMPALNLRKKIPAPSGYAQGALIDLRSELGCLRAPRPTKMRERGAHTIFAHPQARGTSLQIGKCGTPSGMTTYAVLPPDVLSRGPLPSRQTSACPPGWPSFCRLGSVMLGRWRHSTPSFLGIQARRADIQGDNTLPGIPSLVSPQRYEYTTGSRVPLTTVERLL